MENSERASLFSGARPIYIWGTEQEGRKLLAQLKEAGLVVSGFIDSDADQWGSKVEKCPVFAPTVLSRAEDVAEALSKPYILIGSMYKEEIEEIEKKLAAMGYEKQVDYYENSYIFQEIDLAENSSQSLILRRIQPGTYILELGSSSGYMTRYLKENLGCSVVAVELDPWAARFAGLYSERLIIADIDKLDWSRELSGETFDYIIFADVLEHLRDPERALKSAPNFLKEDGAILVSIPNIGHNAIIMELLNGNFSYRPWGLLDETHLRFFTRKSILALVEKVGLKVNEWAEIVREPDQTEFRQAYDLFPEAVREFLINREDGHVYQFIAVLKRG